MNIVFLISFALFWVILEIDNFLELLYMTQLSGYQVGFVYKELYKKIKVNFLTVFMYLIIFILSAILNYSNIYLITIFLVLVFYLIIFLGKKFSGVLKLKYTKRVLRIISLYIVVWGLIIYFIFSVLSPLYLLLVFPVILIIDYLILSFVLLILSPIENLISKRYLKKCSFKLSESRRLVRVGITGSYGKTSVKEILSSILNLEFDVLSTPKSFNTPMGICKTVLGSLTNTHEIFVCEMGAKKLGEIDELCKLVDPDMGIVTSVGRQHTNTFNGLDGVYTTKKELPDYLKGKSCVFNLNNKYVYRMYKEFNGNKIGCFLCDKTLIFNKIFIKKYNDKLKCKKLNKYIRLNYFSRKNNFYAKRIVCNSSGVEFDCCFNGKVIAHIKSPLLGIHNVINILLSIALAMELKVSRTAIEIGVQRLKSINARLDKHITINGAVVLNNGYNSNIDSAKFSLGVLNYFDCNNKVVITPGLIDTENSYQYNKEFGKMLTKYATQIVVVKDINKKAILDGISETKFKSSNIHTVSNFDSAMRLFKNAGRDYVILIENDLPDNFR